MTFRSAAGPYDRLLIPRLILRENRTYCDSRRASTSLATGCDRSDACLVASRQDCELNVERNVTRDRGASGPNARRQNA